MVHRETNTLKNNLSKRIINTPSPAVKNTFFYIQEIGYVKINEIAASQRQSLDSFLIAAVTSGKGELIINNETYSLSKGDCFFIDCRVPHFFKGSDSESSELLCIYFNGCTSENYYNYFISQSKNVFRTNSFDRIITLINDIFILNESKDVNAEILSSKGIVDLLTVLLTLNSMSSEYDSDLKQKLAAINNYINEHFNEDLSLENISSKFYISKFYLTREYKKIYGKTIFQHIITSRINYGKKLLRFSDKSIEEIAHLCGFNDQSYFARQFKKSENLTCFAYRKMWRN